MSESPLPEDLDHWPKNPYELLGVTPDVAPRDLRRAYTRLIRVFKPEQFPEHFRRIREAYESLLHYAEFFRFQAPPESAPAPEAKPSENGSGSASDGTAPPPVVGAPMPPRPAGLFEEMQELWQQAVAGQEADAYRGFLRLHERQPGNTDLLLRLYWLLSLEPELDARHVPGDWLVEGLVHNGMTGPLRTLYRDEIEADPAEAASERCTRLLELDVAASRLTDLILWRWQALLRLRRWEMLIQDFGSLGDRIKREDERAWIQLLFALVDEAIWIPEEKAATFLKVCCREIDQHEHLATSLGHAFDRYDFLLDLADGCQRLFDEKQVPHPFLEVIARSWSKGVSSVYPRLQTVLSEIAAEPRQWLWYFDRVAKRSSAVLGQFGRVLDELEVSLGRYSPEPEDAARLAHRVAEEIDPADYTRHRGHLLDVCLRECLDPEYIAQAEERNSPEYGRRIREDWSLRYVYRACQLFWA